MINRKARRTQAEWADIITEFHGSGLDARTFCENKQITLVTFNKWRLRHSKPLSRSQAPAFSRVTRVEPTPLPMSTVNLQIGPSITVNISIAGTTHHDQ